MTKSEIIESTINSIIKGRKISIYNHVLFTDNAKKDKNEFLFFIKPEITLNSNSINLDDILKLIFNKIDEFSFNIKSIRVINAAYLKKYEIINQHYGVIDQISGDCRKYISDEAKQKFEEIYNESFDNANVYGSKELLEKLTFLSPTSLSFAWQNSVLKKLAGGTYSQKHKFDGSPIYIINGFHPRQLEYFTSPGRNIVVFTLTSNTDWAIARNNFIGKTNPLDANKGSIRRELLLKMSEFGLSNIDSTWNGVHLSAGPIESLIELMRYNSNFKTEDVLKKSDFSFGKLLIKNFGKQKTNKILSNPTIQYQGNKTSIFDLTEEMNSDECIEILKEIV